MATFQLLERWINAGVRWVSPSYTVATGAPTRYVRLKLTSSEWPESPGSDTINFGVEASEDGGTNWTQFAGVNNVSIGWQGKSGALPSFVVSSIDLPGKMVRVFIQPSIRILVGINGEIT